MEHLNFFLASCMWCGPWCLFPCVRLGLANVVIVCSSEEERFYWWLIEQTRGWGFRFAASVVLTTSLYQGPMDTFTDVSNECRISMSSIPVFFKWCPLLSLCSKLVLVKDQFIHAALSLVKSWKCKVHQTTAMFYWDSAWEKRRW